MYTIFYSWQSDAPRKINHDFIAECLRDAADKISRSTGQELVVQDGVRGESGMPALADTILERISAAHVYVADISLVYEVAGKDGKRRSPNPNVVFEFGYAMAELSRGRVIGVLNEHFGTPDDLPFDLQHLRWPLRYSLSPDSSAEQKRKCKTVLVSTLQNAIQTVLSADGPQRSLVPKRAAVTNALSVLVEKNGNWQLALKRYAPHELRNLGLARTKQVGELTEKIRSGLSKASTIWELDAIEKVISDLSLSIAGRPQSIEEISLDGEEIKQLKELIGRMESAQEKIKVLEDEKRIIDSELASLACQQPRYSAEYLAQLLAQRDYQALVDLQSTAQGWDGFDVSVPSFGWPQPIFVVFEMLTWLAQADRSGVSTYYEATPAARLECALVTLEALEAVELHRQYAYGKAHWQDTEAIGELDNWISKNEPTIIEFAFAVLAAHPAELALVCT